jgi:transketolase
MKNKKRKIEVEKPVLESLKRKALWLRKKVLDMAVNCGTGHIAPSFSCIEIVVALYYTSFLKTNPKKPEWENRDRFILSKGHASLALYPVLADLGFFPFSYLDKFGKNNNYLGVHAENEIAGIDVSVGSLGHGLSIAAGLALAAKVDKKRYRTVVLAGDGECHEGSVWEAALFAAGHKLNNLIVIIDYNRLSALGFLKDYQDIEPFEKKWESFGWDSIFINGHSFESILSGLVEAGSPGRKAPLAIIAKTTKGKGVLFMENKPIWHYRVPQGSKLAAARRELAKGDRR